MISGLAWSGRGKITRVDVSTDGGRNWQTADLQGPVFDKCLTRFQLPWRWNGESALIQSRCIDSTGYVSNIFPDPEERLTNPVATGAVHRVPGEGGWWGLDDRPGIEHVYFVASTGPREDIQSVISNLMSQPATRSGGSHRPVREPAVVPVRGLVKLSAGDQASNAPANRYVNASSGDNVVVTRWFRHE